MLLPLVHPCLQETMLIIALSKVIVLQLLKRSYSAPKHLFCKRLFCNDFGRDGIDNVKVSLKQGRSTN